MALRSAQKPPAVSMHVMVYRLPFFAQDSGSGVTKKAAGFCSIGLQYPFSGGNKVVFAHLNILHETMASSTVAHALAGRFAEFQTRRQGGFGGVDPFLGLYA
jgi:hypothetical protein